MSLLLRLAAAAAMATWHAASWTFRVRAWRWGR